MFSRFARPVVLVWDSDCLFCRRWVRRFQALDWLGRLRPVGSEAAQVSPSEGTAGWSSEIGQESMWVKAVGEPQSYVGFRAFRRMAWVLPLGWLVLPLLYLPPVPQVGERLYRWIARNRMRLGCASGVCNIGK